MPRICQDFCKHLSGHVPHLLSLQFPYRLSSFLNLAERKPAKINFTVTTHNHAFGICRPTTSSPHITSSNIIQPPYILGKFQRNYQNVTPQYLDTSIHVLLMWNCFGGFWWCFTFQANTNIGKNMFTIYWDVYKHYQTSTNIDLEEGNL